MKTRYLTFLLCCFALLGSAQSVKPYLATVKTKAGITKGVLYKVDSASLVIALSDKFVTIGTVDIRSIKIRVPKKHSDIIQFVTYDPWGPEHYELNPGGEKVRKWGDKDPSIGEEISGHVAATLINVTGNILAAPIQSINPSIANIKINGDLEKYAAQRNELSYFSVYYQSNPNVLAELDKLKKISAGFKP